MADRAPLKPRVRSPGEGVRSIEVPAYAGGLRLDSFLATVVGGRSRAEWRRLIDRQTVRVNQRPAKASLRVSQRDRVQVADVPAHVELEPDPDIEIEVVYEDEVIVVINKPAGLVVHPSPGHVRGTLVNALIARFPELTDPTGTLRPGIVHRLDKDTSGLMVVGRTTASMANLQAQFKHRQALKRYIVLVCGLLTEDEGLIDVPIGRDRYNRQRMSARADGREADTKFSVLERLAGYTLVQADLHTGRTHQIRVHFAYIGHPVAGDRLYGRCTALGLTRQFVHSAHLALRSPVDARWQEFSVPLPEDLRRCLPTSHLPPPTSHLS